MAKQGNFKTLSALVKSIVLEVVRDDQQEPEEAHSEPGN